METDAPDRWQKSGSSVFTRWIPGGILCLENGRYRRVRRGVLLLEVNRGDRIPGSESRLESRRENAPDFALENLDQVGPTFTTVSTAIGMKWAKMGADKRGEPMPPRGARRGSRA